MAISESSPLLPPTELSWDAKLFPPDPPTTSSSSESQWSDLLRDVIIGFSDGLTVPFALTASLSSLNSSRLVILGGLAELFSGMISMGLGAYLASSTAHSRRLSDQRAHLSLSHSLTAPQRASDVLSLLRSRYSASSTAGGALAADLASRPESWAAFRTDLMLGPAEEGGNACASGLAMAASYFLGGLVPMIPYFILPRVRDALALSVAVTMVVLLVFGYVKDYVALGNHRAGLAGAVQTLVIGVLAAGTSYLIVKLLDGEQT